MSFWFSAFGMRSGARRHHSKRTFDWVLRLTYTWEIADLSPVKNPEALRSPQRGSAEGAVETQQTDEKLLRGTRILKSSQCKVPGSATVAQRSWWERTPPPSGVRRRYGTNLANQILTLIPRLAWKLLVFLACSSEDKFPLSAGRSSTHINFCWIYAALPVVLNFTPGHLLTLTYFDKLRFCCLAAS